MFWHFLFLKTLTENISVYYFHILYHLDNNYHTILKCMVLGLKIGFDRNISILKHNSYWRFVFLITLIWNIYFSKIFRPRLVLVTMYFNVNQWMHIEKSFLKLISQDVLHFFYLQCYRWQYFIRKKINCFLICHDVMWIKG